MSHSAAALVDIIVVRKSPPRGSNHRGHDPRRSPLSETNTRACECGCGERVSGKTTKGRVRRFIHGHNAARPARDPEERFWEKVDKRASGGCWEWFGARSSNGYGTFVIPRPRGESGGRSIRFSTHRYAYELLVGPIPEGLVIDHLCRNRACVNPSHMEPVTNRENVLRGKSAKKSERCGRGHDLTLPSARYTSPLGKSECRRCRDERRRKR